MGIQSLSRAGSVATLAMLVTWSCVQTPRHSAADGSSVGQSPAPSPSTVEPAAATPGTAAGQPSEAASAGASTNAGASEVTAKPKTEPATQSKADGSTKERAVPGLQAYVKKAKVKNRAVRLETEGTKALKDVMRKNTNLAAVLKAQRKNLPQVKSGSGDAFPPLPSATSEPQVVVDAARIGHLCDKTDVAKALAGTRESMNSCYLEVLKSAPTAQGTVMLEWFITAAGKAVAVDVHSSDATDSKLAECVQRVHKTVTFNPHQGKMCVVRWPVGFVAPK